MERENETRMPAQRYVDILTEAGFKAVFGVEKNKDILIGLLNVVLPAGRRVSDLAYSTTEVPGFTLSNKSVRLDLRCTGEDGTRFIVEMQCYRQLEGLRCRCCPRGRERLRHTAGLLRRPDEHRGAEVRQERCRDLEGQVRA